MGYVTWIIFGLVAGVAAKFIMPPTVAGGMFAMVLLGILGAMIGGLLSFVLGIGEVASFNLTSFAFAVVGSVIILYGFTFVKKT